MKSRNIKKLHWVCESPSPYNDFLFAYLATHAPIPLQVHYLKVNGTEHHALMATNQRYAWRVTTGHSIDRSMYAEATSPENLFIVGGWHKPIHFGLFWFARNRYVLWNDTPQIEKPRPPLRNHLRATLLQLAFTNARAIMGTGKPALEALERMGAPSHKLVNFPYWVAVGDEFPTASMNDRFTILSIGRLIPGKAFDQIVKLAAHLVSRGRRNFRIDLVGDGPEREKLKAMIEASGLQNYVRMLGWLDNREVLDHLHRCDLFIHPAQWEAYGVVVLEAMALGRAVITSDSTMAGIDRIDPGQNGHIYPFGNTDALADIVTHLMDNPSYRLELGRNAFKTAQDWNVRRSLTILESLLTY